jgi:predicted nuclease of predicted toxin-antitoxin system
VKLLFDENLAPRLVETLADLFPDSVHVHGIDLAHATDERVERLLRDAASEIERLDTDLEASFLILR